MLRGLILGTVSGLALAAVALSAASLLGPQPAGNTPPEPPLTAAPDVAQPTGGTEAATVAAPADDAAGDPAASVTAPVAEVTDPAVPQVDTAPASVPDAAPEVALALPETSAPPALSAGSEAPVLPNPLAEAPVVPQGEADLTVSTTPATPQPPEVVVVEVPAEPAPEVAATPAVPADLTAEDVADLLSDPTLPDVPPATATPAGDPAPAEAVAEVPPAPEAADTSPAGALPIAAAEAAPDPAETPDADSGAAPTEPVPEASPDPAETPDADSVAGTTEPVPEASPDAGETTDADSDAEPTDPATAEAEDEPAGPTLPTGTEGVRINRPATEPPAEVAEPAPEPAPEEITGPALVQFATPFDNPLALPLLSVILIDAGDLADAPTAVAAIPFPVTVAIDPARPGAAEAMAAYRAAGIEVAALVRLPLGAQPVDVAVVYEAAFATLPAAVAVLDIGEGGLQGESAVLPQALDRLATDGRGLAILADGLNSTTRRAARPGFRRSRCSATSTPRGRTPA